MRCFGYPDSVFENALCRVKMPLTCCLWRTDRLLLAVKSLSAVVPITKRRQS